MEEYNFEKFNNNNESAEEITDKEFISRAENIEKEIKDYVKALTDYENSEKGKTLMKKSGDILNVINYCERKRI